MHCSGGCLLRGSCLLAGGGGVSAPGKGLSARGGGGVSARGCLSTPRGQNS